MTGYKGTDAERAYAKEYYKANKDRLRERMREYYRTHKERHAEVTKAYYLAHKEEIADYKRAYYASKQPQEAARTKRWRDSHKEYLAAYNKKWREENQDKRRFNHQKRKARKRLATIVDFTVAALRAKMDEMGGRCYYCGGKYEHTDHVVPLARGGAHALENLVPACGGCNMSKGDKLLGTEWIPPMVEGWT